ncbi:MAG: HAD-IC family P-type ATPase [Methylovulum sp.]|nr:HAD-IC family P-type ATPase [Methylovulum sp.]
MLMLLDVINVLNANVLAISCLFLGVLLGAGLGFSLGKKRHPLLNVTPDAPTLIHWHCLSTSETLHSLVTDITQGLSTAKVTENLSLQGLNRLTQAPPRSPLHLFFAQFKSGLIVVLLCAAAIAAVIGDIKDGLIIIIVIIINALLGFYQEFQAEKSLASLKKMLALEAKVFRDGHTTCIPAEQLVSGDIVLLSAGDKIPADGRLLETHGFEVDESSLTGESMPINKHTQPLKKVQLPVAEQHNMVFMNTVVTRGHAKFIVTATGMNTEMGKVAALLAQSEEPRTPLQIQLDILAKRLATIALLIVLILFSAALWRGEPLIQTAFTAIALAIAAIPEGLPAVVTITLALGMQRMAKQHAIIKRLAAVETLGCITVICTDKTGTLTINQMTVRAVYFQDQHYLIQDEEGSNVTRVIVDTKNQVAQVDFAPFFMPLVLCNNSRHNEHQRLGDPMEIALLNLAHQSGVNTELITTAYPRLAEIPFDARHQFMATFHRTANNDNVVLFVKGAPEKIIQLCAFISPQERLHILNENNALASTGLRVIAVASKILPAAATLDTNNLNEHIHKLSFIGLVGLIDPPRNEVRAALNLCQQAGIAVKMITGDQANTAVAIAHELGLTGDVLTGQELTEMDDVTLAACINSIGVFARTAPEQKGRIVNALKADGHIVAMTGDGVNDAPALKLAHIGIAMGITGTDVAKESAAMILMDDNFATITHAVHEGRNIYENMIKFIRFQLSTNIGAILTVASAPFLDLPMPFTAVQLLWINIIMDGPPAMSLGVDPGRPHIMQEPPREPDTVILSWQRLGNLFSYGCIMACGTLYLLYLDLRTHSVIHATTLAFTAFVLFQVFNVINARYERISAFNKHLFANKMLWLAMSVVILLQILVVHWTPAQALFHTVDLTIYDWCLATGAASSIFILDEMRKLMHKKITRKV